MLQEEVHPALIPGMVGGMRPFIERVVMQKDFYSNKFLFDEASPVFHVRQGAHVATSNPRVPPFMIVHGTKDALAALQDSAVFYQELCNLREVWREHTDVNVVLPGGHHAFGYIPSPRSNALGDAIADFVRHHTELNRAIVD